MITKYDNLCAICGRPSECTHHLIFGQLRRLADADNLVMPMCNRCHNMGRQFESIHGNPIAEDLSKMLGQIAWEKDYIIKKYCQEEVAEEAREAFLKRYGRRYL